MRTLTEGEMRTLTSEDTNEGPNEITCRLSMKTSLGILQHMRACGQNPQACIHCLWPLTAGCSNQYRCKIGACTNKNPCKRQVPRCRQPQCADISKRCLEELYKVESKSEVTLAKLSAMFRRVDTNERGLITAAQFQVLEQSGLPTPHLHQVLDLVDANSDGLLDRHEFLVCQVLIQHRLAGHQLPTTLPLSLRATNRRVVGTEAFTQTRKKLGLESELGLEE